ncbi:type IV pilus modification PilV family protein [Salipaludibacillus sp. CF4.18]|uniref:type IV pilus modification PilV family protein n=1 Tax=Salipaludibacillus sp. CF4.18 TaxID=3373081 RepID=UPI003EE5F230
MVPFIKKNLVSQKGLSLLEVLISLTILAIVIIPISGLFIQSAKSIQISDTILDETYIVQEYMETVTYYSKTIPFDQVSAQLTAEDFTEITSNEDTYAGYKVIDGEYITIKLEKNEAQEGLISLIVGVSEVYPYDRFDTYMETILYWEGE